MAKYCALVFLATVLCVASGEIRSAQDVDWSQVRRFYDPKANVPERRINNGQIATPTDVPWAVGLLVSLTSGTSFCGGALISPTHVLTAASCVSGQSSITAMLGASTIATTSDFVPVSHIRVHPDYSSFLDRDDIAILTLAREPRWNDQIQIINLPRRMYIGHSFNNYITTISGWGETGTNTGEPLPMPNLRFIRSPVITNLSCELSFLLNNIRSTHICSSTDAGAPCVGDQGAPVTVTENGETFLIGIHVFTASRCERGRPAVHVRLTEYMNWLELNTDALIRQEFPRINTTHSIASVRCSLASLDWKHHHHGRIIVESLRSCGNPLLDVPDRRINNGIEAGPTDVPFAVGILVTRPSQTYFCGGTLISLRHILTSAYCVDGYRTITVMLGAYDMTLVQDFITVSSALVHPNYSSFFTSNDLAILTLSRPAQLSERVQIAQLPSRLYIGHSFNNYEATIAGWGRTGSNTGEVVPVRRLLYFRARVITNTSCLISFPLYLSSTNICTSTGTGAACIGDEGGPVTVTENGQTILIGVHSYGFSMGCERSWPSVHTRITEYLTWIENNSDAVVV
ncbi:transmembrane protease serine 9-like [Anopheles marshallii]|uniref:transmembrane protease serine 9-like n=1 Tax=Anopheles marshallii TaxID=1521116 RepID=UPI00237A7586|nr:transmembrane protease serine 9-like [Anopheles marshallii]